MRDCSDWKKRLSRLPDAGDHIPMPPHAYVPGQTARHPENWFDGIKAGVECCPSALALQDTLAWRAGLSYFEAGFFWECHEVLEAVWMQTPQATPEREMVQALIQLANARLKIRMMRPKAVGRLCDMVQAHLENCPKDRAILGLRRAQLQQSVDRTRRDNMQISAL